MNTNTDGVSAMSAELGPLPKDTVRKIFLSSGFEIKPGHEDLKPYVYAAAKRLMADAVAADREQTIALIANNAHTCTFQSLGQYRMALLRFLCRT